MALRINTNVAAMSTAHIMGDNNGDLGTRLERISSGKRINTAADDAAGLVISEGFRAQITGLTMGVRNAEMGSNLVQVAEGSLNEVSATPMVINDFLNTPRRCLQKATRNWPTDLS